MTNIREHKLSVAQQSLLVELQYRVIFEWYNGSNINYTTAEIRENSPHLQICPRPVNKQTVWILLGLGLIDEIQLWPESPNPQKAYILASTR